MARFKAVNMSPRFLPVVLEEQLHSGTFEFALHTLIDSEFDIAARAAALDPRVSSHVKEAPSLGRRGTKEQSHRQRE